MKEYRHMNQNHEATEDQHTNIMKFLNEALSDWEKLDIKDMPEVAGIVITKDDNNNVTCGMSGTTSNLVALICAQISEIAETNNLAPSMVARRILNFLSKCEEQAVEEFHAKR